MGRVLLLVSSLVIIPMGLSAQSRGGMPARGGATPAAPVVSAPVASGMRSARILQNSVLPAGIAHAPSSTAHSPGSHLSVSRSPSVQLVLRRATTTNGTHVYHRSRTIGASTRNGQFVSAGNTRRGGFSEFTSDSSSVPGLGFDYVHVAATHPNAVNRRHDVNDGAVLFPFSGGGYFVPTETVAEEQGEAQLDESAQEEDAAPAERPARARNLDHAPVSPALGPPAPQADVPEFVFVRRDGTVFFAVAYSWEHGALRYISSEGLRRSVARETLDLDATQQFNEQRGMTFRSPA